MKLRKIHWMGIIMFFAVLVLDFLLFFRQDLFYFLLGIAFIIVVLPFLLDFTLSMSKVKEKEEMFLEFIRNLVESVKTGTPIPRAIINVSNKDFGALTVHVKKLANQIALGIPVRKALMIFAYETRSELIARAVELISQAERAGGKIDTILESVLKSITQIEEMHKERRANVYSMVMQGYMIFIIFIIIMIIVEFKFIPLMQGTLQSVSGGVMSVGNVNIGGVTVSQKLMDNLFLALMLIQGLFAGLVIGKLSEGFIKAGIKHSVVLMALAYIITTGAKVFMT